ncbi:DUF7344 domain-containing protein [Halovivax limisalsi]|uniref:DUF7344 domain-containing protein n=1 Tax=Halovivax limisalsi TaxID=1453760 RepID=UPI001FFD5AD3|nr:hypothetical protein [Halovivax limisalsi]
MSDTLHESGVDGENWSNAVDLTAAERHRLLAVDRRRIAIAVLEGRVTSIDLETLAGEIADREASTEPPSADRATTISVELHHNHLPRLAGHDIVRYDPVAQVVHPNGVTIDEPDAPHRE